MKIAIVGDFQPTSLNLWIEIDNLRKGAATSAVQIAKYSYQHSSV